MTDHSDLWWHRDGEGRVTLTLVGSDDPGRPHRENGYRKLADGEKLTADELAAIKAAKALPNPPLPTFFADGDFTHLGYMFAQHPELVRAVDDLAERWAAAFAGQPLLAWHVLAQYVERAKANVYFAVGMGVEPEAHAAWIAPNDPERQAELVAGWAAEAEAARAWSESPEGRAAVAAVAPDDGPRGWSLVPPSNPDHPQSPEKLRNS